MDKVIHVTSSDIEGSRPMNPRKCAVSRALQRELGTSDVAVGWPTVDIKGVDYNLPQEVRDWIYDDVNDHNRGPFSFRLTDEMRTKK